MLLVKDKKKPNKDPFEISEKGFEGLLNKFPGRYAIAGGVVSVTPENITVTPVKRRDATPQKRK